MSGPGENADRKSWSPPKLERLTAGLTAIAGNAFPPGDNGVTNGKSSTPVS